MNTGKLNVLRNGVGQYLAVLGYSVHLNLLGMFNELGNDDGMVLADVGSQLEESLQFVLVRTDIHGRTAQHITGTYQHWEPDSGNEFINVFHRGQRAPLWLIDAQLVQHLRELGTILGTVNVLCRCSQDGYVLFVQIHSEVVGYLSSC